MLPLFVQGSKGDGTDATKDGLIVSRLFETSFWSSSFFWYFFDRCFLFNNCSFSFWHWLFFLCLLSRETNKEAMFAFNENKIMRRGEECSFYGNDKNSLF